jgi:GTPase involved in cell partitioning and DNA repair
MSEENKINMLELLIGIKEDVSVIKTKMSSFEEAQERDREFLSNKIDILEAQHEEDKIALQKRHQEDIKEIKEELNEKISSMQEEVNSLKRQKDEEDAKRWRAVVKYFLTALGGILVAKLPDILNLLTQKG